MTTETQDKHTPGPWRITHNGSYSPPRFEISGRAGDGREYGFAEVSAWPLHAGEAEANARLIAAAPDMLEALEAAERLIDEHHAWVTASGKAIGNTVPGLTLFAVRTAIHKARGEEQ